MEIIKYSEKPPHNKTSVLIASLILIAIVVGAAGVPMMTFQTVCNDDACFEAPEYIALDTPTAQEISVPSVLPSENGARSLYWAGYNQDGVNLVKATAALDLYHNYLFYVKELSADKIIFGSKVVAKDFTYRDGHLFMPDGSTVPVEPAYLFQLTGQELDTRISIHRDRESTDITLTTYRINNSRTTAENLFFMAHSDSTGRVYNDFSLTLLKGKIGGDIAEQNVLPAKHMLCTLDTDRQNYSRLLTSTYNEMSHVAKSLKKRSRRGLASKRTLPSGTASVLGVIAYNLKLLTEAPEYVSSGVHVDTQLALTEAAKKMLKGNGKGNANFKKAYRMVAGAKKLTAKAHRIYSEGNVEYVRVGTPYCTIPDLSEVPVMVQPVLVPVESEPSSDVA